MTSIWMRSISMKPICVGSSICFHQSVWDLSVWDLSVGLLSVWDLCVWDLSVWDLSVWDLSVWIRSVWDLRCFLVRLRFQIGIGAGIGAGRRGGWASHAGNRLAESSSTASFEPKASEHRILANAGLMIKLLFKLMIKLMIKLLIKPMIKPSCYAGLHLDSRVFFWKELINYFNLF